MNKTRFPRLLWLMPVVGLVMAWQPVAGLRAQGAAGQYNISKEILEHKDLNWKPAPNGIPSDVCSMLQVCNGAVKVIALPRATEGGQPVGRGVFLTQNDKKMDALVLERHTPLDTYFFLVSPEGTLVKAAYAQVGARSWTEMGSALGGPVFNKDKVVWHDWVSKLGSSAAAEKKPQS